MSNAPQNLKQISVALEDHVATVKIRKESLLNDQAVRELGEELSQLVDLWGYKRIIVDCSNLDYIPSAVLNKLIVLQKKVLAVQGRLVLCELTPPVRDVFAVTKLCQKFQIEKDWRTAIKSMWGPGSSGI